MTSKSPRDVFDGIRYSVSDSLPSEKDLSIEEIKIDIDVNNSRYGLPTDGGYGWFVVAASFMLLFITFGTIATFGVFLQHYTTVTFKDKSNLVIITFVGSLAASLITLCAIVTGRLSDRLGYRNCILLGGVLFSLGFLLASFATEVWHLFITQGLMVGVGASISFPPAMAAPAQWFDKKRGLATGIAVAGSGVGGLVISPITQVIIDKLNVQWALRLLAIISFVVLSTVAFIIKERTEPKRRGGAFVDLTWFKNEKFLMFFMAGFVTTFGYSVPFYLIPNYSVNIGLTTNQGSLLIGLINGGSAVGRILMGLAADKLGRINVLLFCVMVTSLSCFIIWPLSTNFGTLILFAVLYGFAAGGYVALTPVIIAGLFGLEGLASIVGMMTFSNAIPTLIGTPIASAILNSTKNVDGSPYFLPVIMYAAVSAFGGALFLFRLRFIASQKLFVKV